MCHRNNSAEIVIEPKLPIWYRLLCIVAMVLFPVWDNLTHAIFWLLAFFRWPGKLPPITDPILLDTTTLLAEKIRQRKLKSVDVVQAYIDRMQEIQPVLNSYTDQRFKEALEEAKQVDALIETTSDINRLAQEKPFLGVPFTTKCSIGVKGLIQDSGLVARKSIRAENDAEVVKLLKNAGAIPICVTNVPTLCLWVETSNRVHGTTKNPYDIRRHPGGSSGGESSSISSAASILSVASDLGGSIRLPAFNCGIFGHKPSSGFVPLGGNFPAIGDILLPLLSMGPMCRYATDLRPVLKVLTSNAPALKLDEPVDVRKLKIFYMEDMGDPFCSNVDSQMKLCVRKASDHLAKLGNQPSQLIKLENFKHGSSIYNAIMRSAKLPPYTKALTNMEGEISLVKEFFKIPFGFSDVTLPAIFLAWMMQHALPPPESKVTQFLLRVGDLLKRELRDILGEDGVLICPTQPRQALYHNETILKPNNIGYTSVFNCLLLPCTACPMGLAKNKLPLGVMVVANENNDRLCLAVAEELEKKFGGWTPPCPVLV